MGAGKGHGLKLEGAFALLSYCCSSILLTLLNKAVLSSANFHMNFLLLAVQAFSSVLLLQMFKLVGLASFKSIERKDALQWFPVSLLLIVMIYTSSKALQYLTVAMFTVFKNLTIIIVALGEQAMFRSQVTGLMWLSFALMVASSVVGGFNDLSFSIAGYTWMAINAGASAGYLLYMKRTIKKIGFADFDSAYYSNALGLPVLLVLSLALEDWRGFVVRVASSKASENVHLLGGMALSGIAGFMISFATAWSIRVVTSTTFSMVGALNKLPVALSGMLFFRSERRMANVGFLCSVAISFASGLVYSIAQIVKGRANAGRVGVVESEAKGSDEPLWVSPLKDEQQQPSTSIPGLFEAQKLYHRSYDLIPTNGAVSPTVESRRSQSFHQ